MLNKKNSVKMVLIMGILALLPACQNGGKQSKSQFFSQKMHNTVTAIENRYRPAFDIMQLSDSAVKEKKHILLSNEAYNKGQQGTLLKTAENRDFPYLQYKQLIDNAIRHLSYYKKKIIQFNASEGETTREKSIDNLIANLEHLSETIITTDEYHQEKIKRAEGSGGSPFNVFSTALSFAKKLVA